MKAVDEFMAEKDFSRYMSSKDTIDYSSNNPDFPVVHCEVNRKQQFELIYVTREAFIFRSGQYGSLTDQFDKIYNKFLDAVVRLNIYEN